MSGVIFFKIWDPNRNDNFHELLLKFGIEIDFEEFKKI